MLTLPAFAKINWNLRVLGKRADGYHEICTVFQTVSLHDKLTFELAEQISLTGDDPSLPTDARNLIVRAAKSLRERFSIESGAKIHLEKCIPSPGGLGGGSADAAITLLALNHLWQINARRDELSRIGAALGADVPFFLFGGTAFGSGLGTEIESLIDVPQTLLLIVTPNVHVPTAEAYRALRAPRLTEEIRFSILTICRSAWADKDFRLADLQNDFENTIFRLKPGIARTKTKLLELGASAALMSGSGASVFGIFDNETTRQTALSHLLDAEKKWRIASCETVSQREYQKFLSPCWNFSDDLS